MINRFRAPRLVLASVLSALGALAILAAPAFATPRYVYKDHIAIHPDAVTIDPADHFWAEDREEHGVIKEFGTFPSTAQIGEAISPVESQSLAFSEHTGNLYAGEYNASNLYVFEHGTGPLLETFEFPEFGENYSFSVAVDNSSPRPAASTSAAKPSHAKLPPSLPSNPMALPTISLSRPPVAPANTTTSAATKSPAPRPSSSTTALRPWLPTPKGPFTLSMTATGGAAEALYEYAPSGQFLREITTANVPGGFLSKGELSAVAVDPTDGNILIVDRPSGTVYEFESSGHYIGQFNGIIGGPSEFGEATLGALTINAHGDLYLQFAQQVLLLEPNPLYPTFSNQPPAPLTRESATLNATLGPNEGGPISECHFEAGAEEGHYNFGSLPCLDSEGHPIGTESSPIASEPPTPVHADISGLRGNTAYHYRLVIKSEKGGVTDLPDEELETPLAVTDLTILPPAEVAVETATLQASFTEEEALPTEYTFEYGTSTNYGHTTTPVTLPGTASGTKTTNLAAPIEGLAPNTNYYARIVATNKYGTTTTPAETFTTYRPPTIVSVSSSHVTATSADLDATSTPRASPPARPPTASNTAPPPPTAKPSPLRNRRQRSKAPRRPVTRSRSRSMACTSGATYHFRLVAENSTTGAPRHLRRPELRILPARLPQRRRPPADRLRLPPRLPRLRARLPRQRQRHPPLLRRPHQPLRHQPLPLRLHRRLQRPPGATETIGTDGDLYVATRTDTGWVSHYVGLPGNQTGCIGPAPPTAPGSSRHQRRRSSRTASSPTPPSSRFLDFNDGAGLICYLSAATAPATPPALDLPPTPPTSGTPKAPSSPTSPPTSNPPPAPPPPSPVPNAPALAVYPATAPATSPPPATSPTSSSPPTTSPSPPGGSPLTEAPGSAYDDNLATGKITLISNLARRRRSPRTPPTPAPPRCTRRCFRCQEEFLRFPAVSADGSHVLISTATALHPLLRQVATSKRPLPPLHRHPDPPLHERSKTNRAVEVSRSNSPAKTSPSTTSA